MTVCAHCQQPADQWIANTPLCNPCHHNFLQPLRNKHQQPGFNGRGQPISPHNGPNTRLQCNQCQATWQGTPQEPCQYCILEHHTALRLQHQLTLTPPDNLDDPAALEAWAERLANATLAGIITEQEGRTAYKRATNDRT